MSDVHQARRTITLKGSAQIVKEYLLYAMHNILYQRGVGPLDEFHQVKAYGLNLFMCKNKQSENYIDYKLVHIENFLKRKEVKRVKLVLLNKKTREIFEVWKFDIEYEKGLSTEDVDLGTKDKKKINHEISTVMRQILGAAIVLPSLDEVDNLDFNIWAVPMPGSHARKEWQSVPPFKIENQQEIRLKSFSTSIHKVDTSVQYKDI